MAHRGDDARPRALTAPPPALLPHRSSALPPGLHQPHVPDTSARPYAHPLPSFTTLTRLSRPPSPHRPGILASRRPIPLPPFCSFASKTVITCQPLKVTLQEQSCLRIASFLANGFVPIVVPYCLSLQSTA